jgi:Nucleoplasmin-like domain
MFPLHWFAYECFISSTKASLGETKKTNENVPLFVKCDDKKLVVGTLSGDKCAQIQYDLVFEKEFELSHSSKNVSVYFCGYKTIVADDPENMFGGIYSNSYLLQFGYTCSFGQNSLVYVRVGISLMVDILHINCR